MMNLARTFLIWSGFEWIYLYNRLKMALIYVCTMLSKIFTSTFPSGVATSLWMAQVGLPPSISYSHPFPSVTMVIHPHFPSIFWASYSITLPKWKLQFSAQHYNYLKNNFGRSPIRGWHMKACCCVETGFRGCTDSKYCVMPEQELCSSPIS